MDQAPSLKLIMDKGPREGETLEFKPGYEINVGRVIRGNNVVIKDPGISSKHLTIKFNSESNSGQWLISDLDSSNGTKLNQSQLSPMVPIILCHGDTIKIGEYTSIMVNIVQAVQLVDGVENAKHKNQVRRNPRRRATAKNDAAEVRVETRSRRGRGKMNVVGDNSELGPEMAQGDELTKGGVFKDEVKVSKTEIQKVCEMENESLVEVNEMRKVSTRKARSSTKDVDLSTGRVLKSTVQESEIEAEKVEEVENVVPIEAKQTEKMNSRNAKNSRKDEGLIRDRILKSGVENFEGKDNVCPPKANQECQVSTRRTRSFKEEENLNVDGNVCRELRNLIGVESKKTERRGGRARKNLHEKASSSIQVGTVEEEVVLEDLNSRREGVENLPKEAVEVAQVEVENKSGVDVDIEKMTLGEWFDYLEVYLPKQIHDETEELISAMELKADQFYEFMSQQKNEKDKEVPMG